MIFLDRLRLLWAEARAFLVVRRAGRSPAIKKCLAVDDPDPFEARPGGFDTPENELSLSREAVRRELLLLIDLVSSPDQDA
jgi:hypothetical protein